MKLGAEEAGLIGAGSIIATAPLAAATSALTSAGTQAAVNPLLTYAFTGGQATPQQLAQTSAQGVVYGGLTGIVPGAAGLSVPRIALTNAGMGLMGAGFGALSNLLGNVQSNLQQQNPYVNINGSYIPYNSLTANQQRQYVENLYYQNINNNMLAMEESSNLLTGIEPFIKVAVPASGISTKLSDTAKSADFLKTFPNAPSYVIRAANTGLTGALQGGAFGGLYQPILNELNGQPLAYNLPLSVLEMAGLGAGIGIAGEFLPGLHLEKIGANQMGEGGYFKGISWDVDGGRGFGFTRTLPQNFIDTINEGLRSGEIKAEDIPSIIKTALENGDVAYKYGLTTNPKLTPIDVAANPTEATEYAFSSRARTLFDRRIFADALQKQLSTVTDPAEAERLQNLIKDVNTLWKGLDDYHSFYTKLQSQAVGTPDALSRIKAIAEETPNWSSLSPAEKSKLIIDKDPELAQGRLWIKAFTPEQNIAVNDFLKNNWSAKLYGSATMHAYFDSKLRIGHDA